MHSIKENKISLIKYFILFYFIQGVSFDLYWSWPETTKLLMTHNRLNTLRMKAMHKKLNFRMIDLCNSKQKLLDVYYWIAELQNYQIQLDNRIQHLENLLKFKHDFFRLDIYDLHDLKFNSKVVLLKMKVMKSLKSRFNTIKLDDEWEIMSN